MSKQVFSSNKDFQIGLFHFIFNRYGQARRSFGIAAQIKYPPAFLYLGIMYQAGFGVEKNLSISSQYFQEVKTHMEWFKEREEIAEVSFHMANYLLHDPNAEKNEKSALTYFQIAADKGYAEAQRVLGWLYETGYMLPKDEIKAVEYYRKSAANLKLPGYSKAQYSLGLCYQKGIGVKKDSIRAFSCIQKAARRGLPEAQLQLARYYENGYGDNKNQQKNKTQILPLIVKAAQGGNVEAQYLLAKGCHQGIIFQSVRIKPNYQAALAWYKKAAEQNHIAAQRNLGMFYRDGLGTEQDEKEALRWLKKTAELGDEESLDLLASIDDNDSRRVFDFPDGIKERYFNEKNIWQCIKKLLNKTLEPSLIDIIIGYCVYNGLEQNQYNPFVKDCFSAYCFYYQMLNYKFKPNNGGMKKTLAEILQDELMLEGEIDFEDSKNLASLYNKISISLEYPLPEDPPISKFLISINNLVKEYDDVLTFELDKYKFPLKGPFNKMQKEVYPFIRSKHIISFLLSVAPDFIYDKLNIIYGKLNTAYEKLNIVTNLYAISSLKRQFSLQGFDLLELWNSMGLNPINILEILIKNTTNTVLLEELVIELLWKFGFPDLVSQSLINSLWARILRYLDREQKDFFMNVIDKKLEINNLAKVAVICQYKSKAIKIKLDKSEDDFLSIKILIEILNSLFSINSASNKRSIYYFYDPVRFIEEFFKPERIFEAIKRGTCGVVKNFKFLIDTFFPEQSEQQSICLTTFSSHSYYANFLNRLESFNRIFGKIMLLLIRCAPLESKSFWQLQDLSGRSLFNYFFSKLSGEHFYFQWPNIRPIIDELIRYGAKVNRETLLIYSEKKCENFGPIFSLFNNRNEVKNYLETFAQLTASEEMKPVTTQLPTNQSRKRKHLTEEVQAQPDMQNYSQVQFWSTQSTPALQNSSAIQYSSSSYSASAMPK